MKGTEVTLSEDYSGTQEAKQTSKIFLVPFSRSRSCILTSLQVSYLEKRKEIFKRE